ncbi:hypothetical protein [Geomonas edaphica]|uniref:hypothetical protein n=1 Tax=Geomonas edaphica TaxID=2570226 RepID=UPI0010A7FE55|nr:hypothetical protein [Geomonas edaphica]
MKQGRIAAVASISLGFSALFQAGCSGPAAVSPSIAKATTQPVVTAKNEQPAQAYETRAVSGKAVESLTVLGYTYINLEKDGKTTWVAVSGDPKVDIGRELQVKPGLIMKNFTSKGLNRKFDEIIFSEGFTTAGPVSTIAMQAIGGKVTETMDSGGYTYANLERDGKSVWVAVPATQLKVGQEIEIANAMPMKSFSSKTLNRTFDVIYFSSGVKGEAPAGQVTPPGHPPIGK